MESEQWKLCPICGNKTRIDRPFIFMLMDCETNLPIFVGMVMDIGQ